MRTRLSSILVAAAALAGAPGCVHPHDDRPPPPTSEPHWGYDGPTRPSAWGDLSPAFERCTAGHSQSPVDIETAHLEPSDLPPLGVHYGVTPVTEVNNGHTIQDAVAPGEFVELGGARFDLQQFHVHHPSEHTIDGAHFPLELHFVHRSATGAMLVVGVLVAEGREHAALGAMFAHLPHEHEITRLAIDPASLLPADRHYVTYGGSLTTPPCTEGVTWLVLPTPLTASADQVRRFSALFETNSRPVMPLERRHLRASLPPR